MGWGSGGDGKAIRGLVSSWGPLGLLLWPHKGGDCISSSDQPDDEFPASEQSVAGLADDDFLHLSAFLPILHWGPVHPGHHHLEVGDGSLGGAGVLKCRFLSFFRYSETNRSEGHSR